MASALDQPDLILLFLAAPSDDPSQQFRCNGITRLEKLLFLVTHETDVLREVAQPFTFEPYHYGPYSREVYDAVEFLQALRLVVERRVGVSSGLDIGEELETLDPLDVTDAPAYVERQLSLTADGKDIARILSTRLSPDAQKALTSIKDRYGSMPLRQLLRYVYSKYPDFAARSRIRANF